MFCPSGPPGRTTTTPPAEVAARSIPAISLSVEDGNRARALYERLGFRRVGRNGGSDTLLLKLPRNPGTA